VVPFSLTLVNPGGSDASDVQVDRLSVRLEQENGTPVIPADLLSRAEVSEGTNVYLVKTASRPAARAWISRWPHRRWSRRRNPPR